MTIDDLSGDQPITLCIDHNLRSPIGAKKLFTSFTHLNHANSLF